MRVWQTSWNALPKKSSTPLARIWWTSRTGTIPWASISTGNSGLLRRVWASPLRNNPETPIIRNTNSALLRIKGLTTLPTSKESPLHSDLQLHDYESTFLLQKSVKGAEWVTMKEYKADETCRKALQKASANWRKKDGEISGSVL